MNPRLEQLQQYPFERLNALKAGVQSTSNEAHIALSIGEPKHQPPDFVLDRLTEREALAADLATYPATRGSDTLRESIATWLNQRFGAIVDPATQVLPVSGTREALFSFGQAVLDNRSDSVVLLPNPFYQIYEGAAILGGASPRYIPCPKDNGYLPDFTNVDERTWQDTQLVYLCSPGNPTGAVLGPEALRWLINKAQAANFIIAADECYSEIYPSEDNPPTGLLQVCSDMGLTGFDRCVVFHSLSKRSNLPGLRSGFVAGDARVLERYYTYRTYEGCALPAHVQAASALAWGDERHVVANRVLYRTKFDAVLPILENGFTAQRPQGGFYCWLPTPEDDQQFARRLFAQHNVTVLPGSFLGRGTAADNPGSGHIRVAWVAPVAECIAGAQRLVQAIG